MAQITFCPDISFRPWERFRVDSSSTFGAGESELWDNLSLPWVNATSDEAQAKENLIEGLVGIAALKIS